MKAPFYRKISKWYVIFMGKIHWDECLNHFRIIFFFAPKNSSQKTVHSNNNDIPSVSFDFKKRASWKFIWSIRNLIKKNVKQQKLMTVLRRCSTVYLKFGKIADGVCGRICLLVNVQANLARPKTFSGEFSELQFSWTAASEDLESKIWVKNCCKVKRIGQYTKR